MIPYDYVQLADVNLTELRLVKETCLRIEGRDHSRWLFRTRGYSLNGKTASYLKIWNPDYIRRDHLIKGVECGFYDETTVPALQALIFHQGVCRGYVMQACRPNRKKNMAFYENILKKTEQTGFFAVQYSRFHTFRYGRSFSLIDLEGIHPLAELPDLSSYYHCFFDDREYENFVTALYYRRFNIPAAPPIASNPDPGKPQPGLRYAPVRKVRSLYKSLYRAFAIRMGTIFNHVERIEI